jgi:flagellar hook-associated protein 2
MMQIYNYMLESYPMRREVMYPTHKRSELKRVYSNIVNLSKRSPFYKINLSKENQEYTIGIKEASIILKSKLEEMADPEISGFDAKTVAISDEEILTASLLSQDTEGLPDTLDFSVYATASGQVNVGKELYQISRGLRPGIYNFIAKVQDNLYPLTYIHEERMENRITLNRITDLLNESVPGISAFVEPGASSEYSRIVIISDQAGKNGQEAVTFIEEDYMGVVDYLGLNRIEKPSRTARFSINGVERQTSTNTFHLENKLSITLRQTSEEPVSIKIVKDSSKILSAVENVLNAYNSLIGIAHNRMAENEEHYRATKLITELRGLEKLYENELMACGIKADEKGYLFIDDSLAIGAAQDGGMESLFTRENGFITRLIEKSESIAINPLDYLEKTIVTYPNTKGNNFSNPYVTSIYSGLFFSSYC